MSSLLETLDSAEEAAGWGGPHQLIGVTGRQLAYVSLRSHPVETLMGWNALPQWSAIALIAEGWGIVDEEMDVTRLTGTKRPSRTFGRQRIRAITILGRDGFEASGIRYQDGEFKVMEESPVGAVADCMRRSLGLPTPPPEFPVVELLAQRWLASLVSSTKRGKHQPKVAVTNPYNDLPDELVALPHTEGWDMLRRITSRGGIPTNITAEHAAWMDAGIFARFSIAELPPLPTLLKQAKRRVDAAGLKHIEGVLRRWGLLDRSAA
ncbi:MAG TPA: hypothetical protein VFA83_06900 [Acidimicrobiales bacterium]|nr:hypothetical protein [Acidimicrobiales bacterium]